ncbi:hypothetical protein BXT86_02415 [candidate division WOR-3 bacterium 4484_100]|uniref:Outer membrane lipoprotein BamD-like domain-containing protein n=1 Tax=candidate division WOR-3 bacterium 4484_100 TaxID=1936077 RepID=A0A1V4QFR7_UNCW3|nr:MAG: hypothetical protein BXT86_02415 [candidate division WOR-3 bacterium 4484_100]
MAFLLLTHFLFFTEDINGPEVQELILSGLQYAYIEEFDSARVRFEEIIERYPNNPAGYFFKAALLQLQMMDECQFNRESEYLDLIKKTKRRARAILEKENNLWAEFYLGSAYAYQAVYEGYKRNYFTTFKLGVKGGRIMENIIKEDSSFYDAYLVAGTYEYFWARASRYLPILKLVGGNAEEAIRKIHIAAERSFYCGPTARNSLAFIYGEEGKYDTAFAYIDSLLKDYPSSRTFLWNKAYLKFNKKSYQDALEIYKRLYDIYEKPEDKNYANLAQCKLYIGKCLYRLNDKSGARSALKRVIGYKKYSKKYPQIKEYCREAYGLLSRIF